MMNAYQAPTMRNSSLWCFDSRPHLMSWYDQVGQADRIVEMYSKRQASFGPDCMGRRRPLGQDCLVARKVKKEESVAACYDPVIMEQTQQVDLRRESRYGGSGGLSNPGGPPHDQTLDECCLRLEPISLCTSSKLVRTPSNTIRATLFIVATPETHVCAQRLSSGASAGLVIICLSLCTVEQQTVQEAVDTSYVLRYPDSQQYLVVSKVLQLLLHEHAPSHQTP